MYEKEYLEKPLLGSVPINGKWKRNLTRRPSHPGAGTRRPRPDASKEKDRTRTRQDRAGDTRTGGQESPGTAKQDRERPRHQGATRFTFTSAGFRGSAPFVCCSVLGSAPEGSTTEPSASRVSEKVTRPPNMWSEAYFVEGQAWAQKRNPPSLRELTPPSSPPMPGFSTHVDILPAIKQQVPVTASTWLRVGTYSHTLPLPKAPTRV